jgi:hypothetical protein
MHSLLLETKLRQHLHQPTVWVYIERLFDACLRDDAMSDDNFERAVTLLVDVTRASPSAVDAGEMRDRTRARIVRDMRTQCGHWLCRAYYRACRTRCSPPTARAHRTPTSVRSCWPNCLGLQHAFTLCRTLRCWVCSMSLSTVDTQRGQRKLVHAITRMCDVCVCVLHAD